MNLTCPALLHSLGLTLSLVLLIEHATANPTRLVILIFPPPKPSREREETRTHARTHAHTMLSVLQFIAISVIDTVQRYV